MISFAFLVQATQLFFDILLDPSVPSLPNRTACHGKSSMLQGPASYTRRLRCLMFHLLLISQHSISPLPPQATVYRHRILQTIEHPYQRNQSLMYASSRRWPGANSVLDHPHLRHNPRASSSSIDVHSRPSHCPPRWMLQIPVLPQLGLFLYRDL